MNEFILNDMQIAKTNGSMAHEMLPAGMLTERQVNALILYFCRYSPSLWTAPYWRRLIICSQKLRGCIARRNCCIKNIHVCAWFSTKKQWKHPDAPWNSCFCLYEIFFFLLRYPYLLSTVKHQRKFCLQYKYAFQNIPMKGGCLQWLILSAVYNAKHKTDGWLLIMLTVFFSSSLSDLEWLQAALDAGRVWWDRVH